MWLTVTVATGCNKTTASADTPSAIPVGQELDLRKHPPILFEVFGERDDPRMVPLASLDGGKLRPIRLSPGGWRTFDRLYHRPGMAYILYQDGKPVGQATVKQGMWSRPAAPLYTLPNCQDLIPLAAVTIDSKVKAGITVEFLATSVSLPPAKETNPIATSAAVTLARDIGTKVASGARIPRTRLDSLDFHALAVNTGATGDPTLVVSYIDPNAEEAAAHGDETSYLFAIADKIDGEYAPTFSQTVNGAAARAQYRRYVDHIDLDGNGVDAIVLEGWQYGGDTYPMIMRYKDGRWIEIFRGATNWCLDPMSPAR
jgi:hypothetical protein